MIMYKEGQCANTNHVDTLPHDSMVTVRLSEAPMLTVDTSTSRRIELEGKEPIDKNAQLVNTNTQVEDLRNSPSIKMMSADGEEIKSPRALPLSTSQPADSRRTSNSESSDCEEVNWQELEKTEEQEPRDQSSDDGTALLLARLEQENNLLATNPKSGIKAQPSKERARTRSRPLSMQQLKQLANEPMPSGLTYSVTPLPPMTDLDFWAALCQDYARTAQYLPTLLSRKVRNGVPPPLRGAVWASMSGARDIILEAEFDRLSGETSLYEGIIGKDLGRSFPGVEMFRDPEGDGQRMLGRVLKCFSLYDNKIGYCQGLGFLVGPLLMHMGDKQAFCVLVRLMEHYDLRACFLPNLSGLHVRIHQFRSLLKQHLPSLATHFESLQIEPAYVSQWFLSFFAVTCPLPLLFRIYDVIFAEGASETIMRVALSLMRKNQETLLACTEFEDAMQLLLSRKLWDCYKYNADEFVEDFVSMTGIITHASLQALQASYHESHVNDAALPSEIGSAASRFLGRLWATKSSTFSLSPTPSPGTGTSLCAPSRPINFLRRSTSKQSIASTLDFSEVADSMLTSSTEASRDSANTEHSSIRAPSSKCSFKGAGTGDHDRELHSQIEDLLRALSELQREQAILATHLQREREERDDDRHAVMSLIGALRQRANLAAPDGEYDPKSEDVTPKTDPRPADLSGLLTTVEDRFTVPLDNRRSSALFQTKSQLRLEIGHFQEQLIMSVSKTQDLTRHIAEQGQKICNLQDEVKDGHIHIRKMHAEKQRLEKQNHDLRAQKNKTTEVEEWPKPATFGSGLRELRLGRQNSGGSGNQAFGQRTSSLVAAHIEPMPPKLREPSPAKGDKDQGDLIFELVQAKTAEAVARQEAEEAKAKLESIKKLLAGNKEGAILNGALALGNIFGDAQTGHKSNPNISVGATPVAGGGFWTGWGKKAVIVSGD